MPRLVLRGKSPLGGKTRPLTPTNSGLVMPIYDLRCPKCDRELRDQYLPVRERVVPCPVCGAAMVRRIAPFNPVFKGDGWTEKFYAKA